MIETLPSPDEFDYTQLVKSWSPYIKPGWKPFPLQLAFCILPHTEILYGGSAGGGKSDALLAAALQYVEEPNYSAIIFRKSYQDLIRPGALLDRATSWLMPWLGREIRYDRTSHIFYFPSGAKLAFGHMGRKGASDTMQGAEFHFVGIDEVTQHSESDALYALSRLRRKSNEDIPLRARFTANPGGIGHRWVFKRFGMEKNPNYDDKDPHSPMYIGTNKQRPFIPSRLADNPYLDIESYTKQLSTLDPITRDRLLKGDWSAAPFGRFKPEWFQRYKKQARHIISEAGVYDERQMVKFATIDVAASFREGVGGRQFVTTSADNDIANAEPCWTVIAVWGVINKNLYLLDVYRKQTEIPEVFALMKQAEQRWGMMTFHVEKNGVGVGVAQGARRLGFMVEEIWTSNDKIINSYDAANLAEQGHVFLPARINDKAPDSAPWLDDWEGEVFSWMGLKDEISDQVDAFSTAGRKVAHMCLDQYGAPQGKGAAIPQVLGEFQWGIGPGTPH